MAAARAAEPGDIRQEGSMSSDTEQAHVKAHRGFFPAVIGRDVRVTQGGGAIFLARDTLRLTQGGGQWLIAGRTQTVEQGGAAVLLTREANLTNAFVGVLIAGRTTFEHGARALVSIAPPAAVAGALGLVIGLLLGRRHRAASVPDR
jgi:hypothetical protein